MVTCNEIMTRSVVTSEALELVVNIAHKMDAANVGSIPIVENRESGVLIGILTDRDIVKRIVAPNLSPALIRAHEVMTPDVHTCHPEDDIEKALAKMAEHQVRRIPIVDEKNRVVGMIAQADVARYSDQQTTGAVVGEISEETTRHKLESS